MLAALPAPMASGATPTRSMSYAMDRWSIAPTHGAMHTEGRRHADKEGQRKLPFLFFKSAAAAVGRRSQVAGFC